MKTQVKAIPDGYHTATPYLHVKGGLKALEFYKQAFGAKEIGKLMMPDGTVGHAEIQIGDSHVMLADENPQWGNKAPDSLGGCSGGICLYVEDVDAAFKRAIEAGGKETMPVADQFYGDRSGTLNDPFGHKWTIATHQEDMSFDEMQKRMMTMFSKKK